MTVGRESNKCGGGVLEGEVKGRNREKEREREREREEGKRGKKKTWPIFLHPEQ